ncbi:S-adenosyl-L-methionine-dependent methyltransferase, partial [Phaeosphaeriaceae sp. PMI808]
PKPKNPLQKALKQALDNLPNQILSTLNLTSETLTSAFPESYSIYPPLLLLPAKTFTSAPWQTFLNRHPIPSQPTQAILEYVAAALGTTHVASNAPIPLDTAHMQQANVFRSPVNIAALYRSLGPPPTRQTRAAPSQQDFAAALWVSARQNGINQTWAPAYTMFSRGNVSEKARLLHLPTVTQMRGSAAALDMYAGIGYFAFSYVKAGVRPVVCFEVNGWSVEGMRRGAEMNGWKCRIYTDVVGAEDVDGDADLLVFWMANERVEEVLGKIGGSVGPIRHVNLGLLPRSRGAWGAATRVIEGAGRGWIHAHENVGVDEIRDRTTEVEGEFQRLLEGRGEMKATVEHVESVKLYAPGVMHCVFDVCIDKNRE